MIASHFDPDRALGQIVLTPNRSWTWRANALFVATLMTVSLLVAMAFTWHGFWMILPFTVIEMSLLTACLYYCVRRTHTREVLRLTKNQLVLERGINRPTQRYDFERYFARFFVEPATHPWRRKKVAVRCRGRAVEVGRFLSDADKDDLVRALRAMIARLDAPASSV